ncbi:Nitrilase/cyanide hydratase and apolipoprotein N-acyltransferase family protein, putative [Theobroma cacao]|uniref:Nitrilase/cyanide hydratase and apolipoprotein N-acyltransferase family protein, putative n=1 Tax=Theobroma cacao TaxID=3641 RepID=A0A061EWQ3_THECC|nr:Nitrilase/cyanide hydratase and apolipoprotein N-acyltransferase family protein, putative [Theobroma cacao]
MLPSATLIKTLFSKNILHSNYSQKHQKSVRSTVPKAPNQDQLNIVICFGWLLKFKIGLFQLLVTPDKERNIEHVRKAIEEAVQKGAQLVPCLKYGTAHIRMTASQFMLKILTQLYNTCCVFGTDGKLKAKHRKIHLFDIDIPGEITFMESKTRNARETPTILDTNVGRIGVGICSDIHFQELAMIYAARGAHLLCYPGAFNMTTGPLNWELLWRARCQLFPCFNLLVNSLNFTFGLICLYMNVDMNLDSNSDPTVGSGTPWPDPTIGKRQSRAVVARFSHTVRQIGVLLHQSPFRRSAHEEEKRKKRK